MFYTMKQLVFNALRILLQKSSFWNSFDGVCTHGSSICQ